MTQVQQYGPPPNPTKLTDSRAREFIRQYGRQSWEVDALPPDVLTQLISNRFEELLDLDAMEAVKERERADIAKLRELTKTR